MKTFLMSVIVTLFTASAFASLENSAYTPRHQKTIRDAIVQTCLFRGEFTQKSTTAEEVHIDQGITDYDYTTVLTHQHRVDHEEFETFLITVKSHYSDMYDHEAQDWGAYSVSSVKCELLN